MTTKFPPIDQLNFLLRWPSFRIEIPSLKYTGDIHVFKAKSTPADLNIQQRNENEVSTKKQHQQKKKNGTASHNEMKLHSEFPDAAIDVATIVTCTNEPVSILISYGGEAVPSMFLKRGVSNPIHPLSIQ